MRQGGKYRIARRLKYGLSRKSKLTNLQQFMERGVKVNLLFGIGAEHIGGHDAPDLRLHRVLARAQETLDAKVLFDPLEKQFHLPVTFVPCSNAQREQRLVVGQEDQRLARGRLLDANAAQLLGIALGEVRVVEVNRLVRDQACSPPCGRGTSTALVHAAFGAGRKKSACLVQFVQPL